MMQIKKLSDTKTPKLNVLAYGPPGVGKTYFSGTVARVAKPLILSAESGLLSLKKLMRELKTDFDYIEVTRFEDIEEAYQYLKFKQHATDEKTGKPVVPESDRYTAVIIDSLTEIQQVCMDKILRDEKREKPLIADWGTLNNRMVGMVRSFRDLDLHVVATALADTERDDGTGNLYTKPFVQGRLKETLAGYFDEVFYLQSAETKDQSGKPVVRRWLSTQGTTKVQAKDRSGFLPKECPSDFGWIYNKITAAGGDVTTQESSK